MQLEGEGDEHEGEDREHDEHEWAAIWTGPPSACATSGSAVFSNDGPLSYEPDLTLEEAGSYTISLVATNTCGDSDPTTAIVTVAEPPVASLPALPPFVCKGALVDPSAIVDACGDTDLVYEWTFTSASSAGSTYALPPPITAILPGPLVIELEVSNDCGSIVQTVQTTVFPLGGTMNVVADPSPVCLGETVTLTVTDGPSGVPYTWTPPPTSGIGSTPNINELVISSITANDAAVWNVTAGTGECDALGQVTVVLHPQPQDGRIISHDMSTAEVIDRVGQPSRTVQLENSYGAGIGERWEYYRGKKQYSIWLQGGKVVKVDES